MTFLAFTRAHFDMAGGFRRNMVLIAIYIGLVGVVSGMLYPACPPGQRGSVSSGLLTLISVVQGVLLLMMAPGAMRKAVLRDFQSGMHDSHRLAPMSGLTIALGYLTGPAVQALLLFAVGLVVGSSFATHYGLSLNMVGIAVPGWWVAQVSMILLAFPVLTLALLTSILTAGKMNLLTIGVVAAVFGGWFVVALVPGVALLSGVMQAEFFFHALSGRRPPVGMGEVFAWTSVLQLLLGCVVLAACSRKIRRPDLPAFSVVLGSGLLTIATAACVVGLHRTHLASWLIPEGPERLWQWFASAIALMLLAMVPVASAAATRYWHNREAALRTGVHRSRVLILDVVPLVAGLAPVVFSVLVWSEAELPWDSAGRPDIASDVVLVLAGISSAMLVYVSLYLQSIIQFARYALVLPALIHVVPLVIDQGVVALRWASGEEAELGVVFGHLSPLGTLLCVALRQNPWPGLIAQAAVLGVLIVLTWRAARRTLRSMPARILGDEARRAALLPR
jgi:hypothetical protein